MSCSSGAEQRFAYGGEDVRGYRGGVRVGTKKHPAGGGGWQRQKQGDTIDAVVPVCARTPGLATNAALMFQPNSSLYRGGEPNTYTVQQFGVGSPDVSLQAGRHSRVC